MSKEKMTINEGFEKLQLIMDKMDDDSINLEDSFNLYNEGIKLVKELNGKLDETEKKLIVISEQK